MSKAKDIISGNQLNDTVAQLYALRAGLSVISECADDIRNNEHKIEGERARVKPINSDIERNTNSIHQNERKIQDVAKEIDSLNEEITHNQLKLTRIKYKRNFGVRFRTVWVLVCFILGSLLMLPGLVNLFIVRVTGIVLLCLGISLLSFALLYSGIKARKDTECEHERIQKIIENRQEQIDILNNDIVSLVGANNDLTVANKNQNEKKDIMKKEIKTHISEIESNIVAIAQEASLFNTALENEYARLLNPADWHNIDLCIFYLQTGRADSIKECLLLADRQRQNDEIVGAITAAEERICGEIRGGFRALGNTMVTCINALSMQIDAVGSSLATQHDETIRALGAVENSNAALLSATQLNNALQAKANETNEALMRDYKYVQNRMGIAI